MTSTEAPNANFTEKKTPIICLQDIVVSYQTNVAIFDINIDIFQNDFIGMCGPNGSGKSTILKVILGLVKPLRGAVKFFGKEITKKGNPINVKQKIGYVPQMESLDRNFPAQVKDVVAMGLYSQIGFFKGLTKENYAQVQRALEIVELEQFEDRPIGHLSIGQQQKVMIARGIVNEPKILLLDEPTASLDFKVGKNIMCLIKNLIIEKNLTIVLVSHDIDFIKNNCTKAICLNKRIVWEGQPQDSSFDQAIELIFQR